MIKLVASGIWICTVTLLSAYFAIAWKVKSTAAANHAEQVIEFKKTRAISVPVIAEGAVQGYVVARFGYTIDTSSFKHMQVPVDVILLDEAFRTLYSDQSLDFRHLEKYDLTRLTRDVLRKMNLRLDGEMVKDVFMEEFNYVARDEIPK
jgi:hypothetical protein